MTQGCWQWADHMQSRAQVGAYLDGELTGARRARVAAHLAACWACSGYAQALRLVTQSLRTRAHRTPPDLAGARLRRFAEQQLLEGELR
jgi:anti-sigma factor RsiW